MNPVPKQGQIKETEYLPLIAAIVSTGKVSNRMHNAGSSSTKKFTWTSLPCPDNQFKSSPLEKMPHAVVIKVSTALFLY
jgi:hypothetical protein